jgi:hypothetical protein
MGPTAVQNPVVHSSAATEVSGAWAEQQAIVEEVAAASAVPLATVAVAFHTTSRCCSLEDCHPATSAAKPATYPEFLPAVASTKFQTAAAEPAGDTTTAGVDSH